jgi:ABC-type multidrug transport system ATPase subunit/pSer/pThr/pTyr-binding forkhead associated (FHA) protein
MAIEANRLIQQTGADHGREILLNVAIVVGRSEQADVVVPDASASRRHLELRQEADSWVAVDLKSTNGTLLDGALLTPHIPVRLQNGARLQLGDSEFLFTEGSIPLDPPTQTVPLISTVTIGRASDCDIVIPSPNVSGVHCQITQTPRGWLLEDMGWQSGTFLNGVRVLTPEVLREGDEICVHLHRFVFRNGVLEHFDTSKKVRIEVEGLQQVVKKDGDSMTLLRSVSFVIPPQEFVAIVGGSGVGKSTLLNAMAGFQRASRGVVRFNGANIYENLDLYRTTIGYVPQEDFIHRELRVVAALRYAAELRLPSDTSQEERDALVEDVLRELDLSHRKSALISTLSGGERKRVNVAMELLSRPGVLFLDEPTAGLDPGLERKFVAMMKELAHEGRTVVMVTHATGNIAECDKLLFLARGGRVAFYGPPQDALTFFGVTDYADAYLLVNDNRNPAHFWEEKFLKSEYCSLYVTEPLKRTSQRNKEQTTPKSTASVLPRTEAQGQFRTLVRRYVDTLRGDRRNLVLLMAQSPLTALILLSVFPPTLFSNKHVSMRHALENSGANRSFLLFCMVISALLFGVINATREFTKERAIYRRERMVNLQPGPYFLSKAAVLSLLCVVQSFFLVAIVQFKIYFPLGVGDTLMLMLILALTAMCGSLLGLTLSALANTSDQAMSLVPFAILPQIVFSGLIDMQSIGTVEKVMPSYWAYGALGNLMQLNATSADFAAHPKEQFNLLPIEAVLALIVIGAGYASLAFRLLRRRR